MKKLGLIGGMWPESTIPYYHDIVYGVQNRIGKDFFKKPFYSSNIEIITPTTEEMEYINSKISSELELGITKEETLRGFQKIIKRMQQEDGIEAIILGCTELPLLLNDAVCPIPCLDTMKIHIRLLIDLIVEKEYPSLSGKTIIRKNIIWSLQIKNTYGIIQKIKEYWKNILKDYGDYRVNAQEIFNGFPGGIVSIDDNHEKDVPIYYVEIDDDYKVGAFFERYSMVRGKRNRDGRENEGTVGK